MELIFGQGLKPKRKIIIKTNIVQAEESKDEVNKNKDLSDNKIETNDRTITEEIFKALSENR
jgi:hypothetical protein